MSTYDDVVSGSVLASGGEDVIVTLEPARFEAFLLEFGQRMQSEPSEDCPSVSIGKPLPDGGMCWICVRPRDWRDREERLRRKAADTQVQEARQQRMLQAGGI